MMELVIDYDELLGAGSYGQVFKGRLGTEIVAIKDVPLVDENQPYFPHCLEARLLTRARHPKIVHIYTTCVSFSNFYMVMEYSDCGSLHQTLHGREPIYNYSTAHSLSWARQCAEGIAFLHAMQPRPVIHRDIKPTNLLLFQNRTTLKIGDFGTARDISNVMTNGRGSAAYMAPEVFATTSYDEKCDVYSWAIVLWEILTREKPFKQYDNPYTIMWNVHGGERPDTNLVSIPEPLRDFLVQCWQQDHQLRSPMEYVTEAITLMCNDFPGADEPVAALEIAA